jgi:hypothetical protein
VQPHQEIHAELERDPLAPLALGEADALVLDLDRGPAFGTVPVNRDGQADVLARRQVRQRTLVGVGERRAPRQDRPLLRLDDRVRRADEFRARDALVHHQALQNPAHLRVALFVPREIGREVIERADRAADVRQRQAREQFAVRDFLRREGDRHRQEARSHALPAGRDPERGAAAD